MRQLIVARFLKNHITGSMCFNEVDCDRLPTVSICLWLTVKSSQREEKVQYENFRTPFLWNIKQH